MKIPMDKEKTSPGKFIRIVNYSIAVFFALLGTAILAGYPVPLQGMLRWMLGIVLLLWAIYRGITTRTKFPVQ